MRTRPALLAVLLLCLPAAAVLGQAPRAFATPTEKLDYLLSTWRGKTLSELTSVWGREETVERRGDHRVYVFERRVKVRAGILGVAVYANGGLRCVARFEIDAEEKIVRTARQGGGQECWNAFRRYEP